MVVTWSAKDKAAIEATEMGAGTLGGAADMAEFERETYNGTSWNIFVTGWQKLTALLTKKIK